jgi:hypothetical protein
MCNLKFIKGSKIINKIMLHKQLDKTFLKQHVYIAVRSLKCRKNMYRVGLGSFL